MFDAIGSLIISYYKPLDFYITILLFIIALKFKTS